MNFVIVTGLSGSGKSNVINVLEDIDFVCIDNLPPKLLPAFGQIVQKSEQDTKTAIVTDVRSGAGFRDLFASLDELRGMGIDYKILFTDADDKTIANRYKETRRKHPLSNKYENLADAISAEREILEPVKQIADFTINSTNTTTKQFRERVASLFLENLQQTMQVQCMSFGFKYGTPADADLVFDVRCLPNPFYIDSLRMLTGLNVEVSSYVMKHEQSQEFFKRLTDLIDYTLPLYREEGKSELVIAFGCTGGKHRSVTFAEEMFAHLKDSGVPVSIMHRDISK